MERVRRVLACLHHVIAVELGCCSHTADDQRTALRLPREVVYTNTGAQVDSEKAPRVLHLAGSSALVLAVGLSKIPE